MTATPITVPVPSADDERWAQITARAPKMAATMRAYLDQVSVSLRPRSVDAADNALRCLATYLVTETRVRSVKGLRREHIEGFKLWLAQRPAGRGKTLAARTIRHRLGILRVFLERLIDWDSPDAPRSCPILQTDLPRVDDPLPRFLDDTQAAALMRTAAVAAPFDRLIIEMLARTGLGYESVSSAPSKPTPSCASAPPTGSRSPSASSATTATCRCTRSWSSCSTPGAQSIPTTTG